MTKFITHRSRDYAGPVTNTDIWNSFELRADDIIVTTPPKCGTTWVLSIVMMLIRQHAVSQDSAHADAPWLDSVFRDRAAVLGFLNGLSRRRCIKSHTPMDGILYAKEPLYVSVYRHPVDMYFSMRSHVANMKADIFKDLFPTDERAGFQRFVTAPATESGTDDLSLASMVLHYEQAKSFAKYGNIHFFHYADLSRDLRGQIMRLSDIMGVPLSPELLDDIAEANTFSSMRKAAEESETRFHENSPFIDQAAFFASGTSNKWEGRLTQDELDRFDQRFAQLLPQDDITWLKWGEAGTPSL